MTEPRGVHNEVLQQTRRGLPTATSSVCRCGAVFDNGNLVVPAEMRGLCGRCAFERGVLGSAAASSSGRTGRAAAYPTRG